MVVSVLCFDGMQWCGVAYWLAYWHLSGAKQAYLPTAHINGYSLATNYFRVTRSRKVAIGNVHLFVHLSVRLLSLYF